MWLSLRSLFRKRMGKKNITFFFNVTRKIVCSPRYGAFKAISVALFGLISLVPAEPLASDMPSARQALLLINTEGFQSAFNILEELASKNDPQALLELSELYSDGHFLPVDPVKSQNYMDRAVVTGNQRALWNQAYKSNNVERLRLLYRQGFSAAACSLSAVEPELDEECATAIKKGASEGDLNSLYALKVFRQDSSADSLLKKFPYPRVVGGIASNQWLNDPDKKSLLDLVKLVRLGSVIAAVNVIKQNSSLTDAQKRFKRELLRDLTPPDKEYIRETLRSVAGGNRQGWFGWEWYENDSVGRLFFDGEPNLGISLDYELAFTAFQQCAVSPQDSAANLCLYQQALMKESGGPGLMRDPIEALNLFTKSHERGNYTASAKLADIYRTGALGVGVNFQLAGEFAIAAVERGNRWAAERLAMQYMNGQGVPKDTEKASYFFEVAATDNERYLGSPRVMITLAEMNESGAMQDASLDTALFWFKAALDADETRWKRFGDTSKNVSNQKRLAREGFDRVSTKLQMLVSESTPSVEVPTEANDFGSYKVLIIANQSYETLTNLSTPKRDAGLVGSAFETRFDAEVEYLFDADRVEMLSALNRYRKELMPTDNFILYYAGHGVYDEELNIGYWQPVDSTMDEDYTWIDTDRISRTLSGFKSRNALVVADSCFSGSVVRGRDFTAANDNSAKALLALSGKRTRMAITSGGLQPVLDVTGNSDTSAFASNLTNLLYAVDRPIPVSSVFPALRSSVTAETAAWGFEQIPEMAPLYKAGHDGGDFILSPQIQSSN